MVTHLSLGDQAFAPLKQYLRKHAKPHQAASVARSYAMFKTGSDKVCAYVTIICGEIEVKVDHNGSIEYPYDRYPAVKIARLAVDRRVQGYGLGKHLVQLAVGITSNVICPAVGCRFIVVDSKQQSVGFYERCGFTMIATPENRQGEHPVMFIDLHKARDQAAPAASM